MTTRDIELRTEIVRKRIVLDRIRQPGERFGVAAVALIGFVGVVATVIIGYVFARAL